MPWDVIDRYGADALRWYFFTSKQPWDGYRFSLESIGEGVRQFLLQLWNTYSFFVLYANAPKGDGGEPTPAGEDLDRWVRSRLAATVAEVTRAPGRLRRHHRRPRDRRVRRRSQQLVRAPLAAALLALGARRLRDAARLPARPCRSCSRPSRRSWPTRSTTTSTAREPSVHLCDFPEPGERDEQLEFDMATAREAVRLGLAARGQAKVKVRQPLREAVVVAAGREREAIERLAEVVREELNVKSLRFVEAADELGRYEVKPNFRDARARASASGCPRWPRRWRRWTPRTWPRRCARSARSGSRSTATTTSSAPTTSSWS